MIGTVALVYSQYRLSETFDQPALNKDRFESLKKEMPQLFENPKIKWLVIEQSFGSNPEEAKTLFHGFVITYYDTSFEKSREDEVSMIERIIFGGKDTTIFVPEKIITKIKRTRIHTGTYQPKRKGKLRKGLTFNKPGIWGREEIIKTKKDTIIVSKTGGFEVTKRIYDLSMFKDSAVIKVFERHKNWTKMAYVVDVTGSMSPFSTQMLVWIKENKDILNHGRFLFFNDGDGKPEYLKSPGHTGGLYPVQSTVFDTVKDVMIRAMLAGGGGDLPENNIEALLKAQEVFKDVDTLVMVADNMAAVNDMKLLGALKKPVKVIACGINVPIMPDLLMIAKTTKGSFHTLNKDFENLGKISEGQILDFGRESYVYRGGKFIVQRKFVIDKRNSD